MNKAMFLDRDGVIIKEVEYLHRKQDISLLDGASEAIKFFKERGFLVVVISNQPVIARGLATEKTVEDINECINDLIFSRVGTKIDRFYCCPHHPNASVEKYKIICTCRKPDNGLLLKAAKELDIDLSKSFMVGDRTSDIAAGKKSGCKTALIEQEYSREKLAGKDYDTTIEPDFVVKRLFDTCKVISK
jgi:D,D-heptose 1,7-bisphosphate phosphatase